MPEAVVIQGHAANQTMTNTTAASNSTWFSGTIEFIQQNALYIIGGLVLLFILFWLMKKGNKKKLGMVNRPEIERKNFIRRMKLNRTKYKWLERGEFFYGKIKGYRSDSIKNIPTIYLVYKPPLIDFKAGFLHKLLCIFTKEVVVMVRYDQCRKDTITNRIIIDAGVDFDNFDGIYYDRELMHDRTIHHILDDTHFRTDLENLGSVYYMTSMDQATASDPDRATTIQTKQLDLEAEKEKRKHLVS